MLVEGKVEGSEELVDEGEEGGVVFVDDFGAVVGVVPVMEGWGGDEPLEGSEAEADVGVDEEAPDGSDEDDQDGDEALAAADG